jgi:hypothetical protein
MQYLPDGKCGMDLRIPQGMSCREYHPGLQKFCADPNDFVDCGQVVEMAAFFGIKGTELKKVRAMGLQAEKGYDTVGS